MVEIGCVCSGMGHTQQSWGVCGGNVEQCVIETRVRLEDVELCVVKWGMAQMGVVVEEDIVADGDICGETEL